MLTVEGRGVTSFTTCRVLAQVACTCDTRNQRKCFGAPELVVGSAGSWVLSRKCVECVTLGAWRRALALLELAVRLNLVFSENVLVVAVCERFCEGRDIV